MEVQILSSAKRGKSERGLGEEGGLFPRLWDTLTLGFGPEAACLARGGWRGG